MDSTTLMQAVVNRLIPADEYASGWDAGVGDYLARHWDGDLAPKAALIEQGLEALQTESIYVLSFSYKSQTLLAE